MTENKKAMLASILKFETRQLTHDLQRTLVEEEKLLEHLNNCGDDAWLAYHKCRDHRSQHPPLYIYFQKVNYNCAHRKAGELGESCTTTDHKTSTKAKATYTDEYNRSSILTLNRSQKDEGNSLSFSEYTEMEPSLKISCIRSLLFQSTPLTVYNHRPSTAADNTVNNDETSV